jgi:hypothetical protein
VCFVSRTVEWILIKFRIDNCGILGSHSGEKKKSQRLSERWKDSALWYPLQVSTGYNLKDDNGGDNVDMSLFTNSDIYPSCMYIQSENRM